MINEDEIHRFLNKVQNRLGGDIVDHGLKGLSHVSTKWWLRFKKKGDMSDETAPFNRFYQQDDQDSYNPISSDRQVLSRTSKKVGTIFSTGIETAGSVISKATYVTDNPIIDSLADCLGPFGTVSTVTKKTLQLVSWMKTRAHLSELMIIYEFARQAKEDKVENMPVGETLDAIAYAISQKTSEKRMKGIQGCVPMVNQFKKIMHRFKKDRGEKRGYYANVLARNAKESKDPWAQWTVRCLVGKKWTGYDIGQLMKELETKLTSS
jgi:hypothetical protein